LIVGLDHVQVAAPAGCENDARNFYGDLLGLEEIEKPPLLAARGGAWFRLGEQELHVGVADAFAPATKAHPALRLSSARALEVLARRLEHEGVTVIRPDPDETPETARIFVADPWGNRLELLAATHIVFT
jgi:catechol 2,3-dioxygenase-like lactoylglutathione lyase family enzyme